MGKALKIIFGLALTIAIGALIKQLASAEKRQALKDSLQEHYDHAIEEAKKASAAKRQELEDELERIRENRKEEDPVVEV